MKTGLIAGGGSFPILFAEKARRKGLQVYAAAYVHEAGEELARYVTAIEWFHLGQVARLLKFFKKNGVDQAVMLGPVRKTRIFSDIKPDFKALSLISRMAQTHDNSVLISFADFLEKEGIQVRPSTYLLPELVNRKGCWTKKKPSKAEKHDIHMGWPIAKAIGRLDIGQCIVVGNGSVLAVEAVDGTDATIRRGGSLAGKGAVAVKLAKPQQDLRFDLPATGLDTVKTMDESGVSVLVVEAEKSISFDRDKMIAFADKKDIAIVAMSDAEFKFGFDKIL